MKIAINTRFLLPNKLEGIGWYSYEVTKRLVERYPQHEFLLLFDRPFSPEFVFGSNATPLVVFPQARHPLLFYWWFEWSLPRIFRQHRPDLFFSPDGFLSLRSRVPTLLTIHDIAWQHFPQYVPWAHRQHYQYFMPRFARRAEHITTVSDYSKQDIIQYLNVDASKISVAHPAGSPLFQPIAEREQVAMRQQYAEGQPYFVYVGSIHPRKNVPRLLEAFERFKQRTGAPHRLVLVGRMAWQTGDVGATWNAMRHRDQVHFLGYLPSEEMVRVVAASFASVYPSLFEGFGIPIVEAMQAGTPVITSNTSSMPEAAGDAALLADPYSVESIADQLERLLQEPNLRETLIAKGRTHCQSFSWDKTTDGVVQGLEKALGRGL